jgi:single-strand DNA-binding protein
MAKSINKVILIGNLGRDPEIKQTSSGAPVAKFSLATNERFKGKGGEWQERTEWHNIVAWRRLAEIIGEYAKQGAKVYVEGRLQTSSWEDKQSKETKYRTDIVAQELVLLDAPGERASSGDDARSARNQSLNETGASATSEIDDSEIPF